jgi:hypothetical protein
MLESLIGPIQDSGPARAFYGDAFFEIQHAEYISAPGFKDLEAKAHARGYRKATPAEVRASYNSEWWAQDLYCWAGGLWIKASGGMWAKAADAATTP